ncbi:MAG: hypothetical protein QOK89_05950 [Nitrososphaeraceae archaeon]|nr:hypothetical protein [Nitrososphaeraceae archaeon]
MIKKKYIEQLRYNTPTESVLLYQDEKGPIVAKTYGGKPWSPVQSKIEKACCVAQLITANTFS